MLVSFFSSKIPLYIEKNLAEKLCKVLEMELKAYNPIGPKFVFKQIKFKVLHYLQHGFICQRPGLNKDQAIMFKFLLLINYFDCRYEILLRTHSYGYMKGGKYFFFIKRRQIFLFYKSRCCRCSLLIKPFITMHKKWSFPLSISSVNVTKSAVSCKFGHIYWRNP